jgi:hypothetical protein
MIKSLEISEIEGEAFDCYLSPARLVELEVEFLGKVRKDAFKGNQIDLKIGSIDRADNEAFANATGIIKFSPDVKDFSMGVDIFKNSTLTIHCSIDLKNDPQFSASLHSGITVITY